MGKKYYFLAVTAAIFLGAAFAMVNSPKKLTGGLYTITGDLSRQNTEIKRIYHISFPLHGGRDTAATYIPVYGTNGLDAALYFAGLFDMNPDQYEETEDCYTFRNGIETLKVYKYMDRLYYEKEDTDGKEKDNFQNPIDTAIEFINSHQLRLSHVDSGLFTENGAARVELYGKLGGRFNHAFPNRAKFDHNNNLVFFDYYYFAYERISNVDTISLKEAVNLLPVNFNEETQIDLKKYSLVYFFNHSVIEPGYLFEGEFAGGGQFRHIVPAADYR